MSVKPDGFVRAVPDPRPWWRFWQRPTVSIVCDQHGLVKEFVPDFITESGFDPAYSIARLHAASHHNRKSSRKSRVVESSD